MKRISVFLLVLSSFAFAGAQSAPACVDLPSNLSRGAESSNVLKLQQFLFAKGLLKATPNGYFGPGTLAAVKAYQKSVGLSQVGNVGPATRSAIKKESCAEWSSAQTSFPAATQTQSKPAEAVPPQTSAPIQVSKPAAPFPSLDSIDFVTLFAGGTTDWSFNIYGRNFSTSTENLVQFKHVENRKTYTIGTFSSSATGTKITLPSNLTNTRFACGVACSEVLPAGEYRVTVTTSGGETEGRSIKILAFTLSAQTAAVNQALPASATSSKFGTLSFSSPIPILVKSIALETGTSSVSSGAISSVTIYNELSGSVFQANTELLSYQSMITAAYVKTTNLIPGTLYGAFKVEIEDFVGKKKTSFTSVPFMVTIEGAR